MKIFKPLALVLAVLFVAVSGFASSDLKFNLKVGGTYLRPEVAYDYGWDGWYAGERMELSSTLVSSGLFGGSFGVGLTYKENYEFYANFSFFQKTLAGDITFTLPSYTYWDEIATTTGPTQLKMSESIIDLGFAYHFALEKIKPYVGLGLSLISGEIETPTLLTFTDHHEGTWHQYSYYWYTYYWFELDEHKVNLDEVDVKRVPISKTGFHFKAGVSFPISANLEFFLEGKYITAGITEYPVVIDAKASGRHYLGNESYADTRRFNAPEEEDFQMSFGGLSGVVGVKIVF